MGGATTRAFKDIIKAKLHYGGGEARKVVKTARCAETELIESGEYTTPAEKAKLRQERVQPKLDAFYKNASKRSKIRLVSLKRLSTTL